MNKHFKLKYYKGIDSIELKDLGQINIIIGKNNSGKSSILEAMTIDKYYGLGRLVDESIKQIFLKESKRYSTPSPSQFIKWYTEIVNTLIYKNTIWYSSDIDEILAQLSLSFRSDSYLKQFQLSSYDFKEVLTEYFKQILEIYKPFLIPAKRSLVSKKDIQTDEKISPQGEGIINKLFYLKNQDLKSIDYKLYTKIYDNFESITMTNFNLIPKSENKIELFFLNNGKWFPAKDSGLGLLDTLIIISLILLTNYTTYLIEEPESHLHAEFQKRLLEFFKNEQQKQFILATHSNIFLNTSIVDKIFYTEFNNHVTVSDETSKSHIISSLGFSITDNLASDIIILVEGPTDIPILKTIFEWKNLNLKYDIKFWPLCGDIMNNLELEVLAEGKLVVALIDSDPGSSSVRDEFINNCKKLDIDCTQLERYAIENYLTLEAIKKEFGSQIDQNLSSLDNKICIKDQIGFKIKSKNYKIIRHMTIEDIKDTDLLAFCVKVESLLDKGHN